ncbi:MAG: hypothetical protein JJ894_03195 [Dinoroseobacter sp.]|nr:hypothetical protein [Dinoroseobacter sp.]
MAALSANNKLTNRDGVQFSDPVKAGVHIYEGAMVGLDASGYLAPAATAGISVMRGFAMQEVDNTGGADGDLTCLLRKGVGHVAQTGLARTDIETLVSVTDDATVGGSAALKAGTLVDLDAAGAWVRID